jgi:thiol-disulfide isomerase/thioredoxin
MFANLSLPAMPALPSNTWLYVGIGFVVAAVVVLAVLFVRNKMKQKELVEEDDDGEKTCEIYFFYTTWCPICKKIRPDWDKFAAEWNGKIKDGVTVLTNDIDCDQNEALANKYAVNGYPTVKCLMNNKITELDGNPTFETLNQFLDSCFSK